MTSTSSPPPYTAQPTITVAQKLELVQAELEVAKLRLRKQAGERQGKQRVASSRRAVLQRLVPRVVKQALSPPFEQTSSPVPEIPAPLDHRRIAWNMILSEEHPPSGSALASLKKIMLRDLSMETHHSGKMLLLRTITASSMHSSMQTAYAVEDERGDIELLTIHDFAVTTHSSKAIQNGTFFVVKEPFYRSVLDEDCVLCVDHPADIVFLDADSPILPDAWRSEVIDRSSVEWKQAGNHALQGRQFIEAERCYSRALSALTAAQADDFARGIIHRNRAQARLCLHRHDGAYSDALAGVRVLPNQPDPLGEIQNIRALYRAGRAAYELGAFDNALSAYKAITAITPLSEDCLRELKRTESRIVEQATGVNMWKATGPSAHGTKVDHADFLRRTEARQTAHHGRGLFAVEAIPCGDIVLSEKALAFVPSPVDPKTFNLVIPPGATRGTFGTQIDIWTEVIQRIVADPSIAPKVLSLYAGPNYPPLEDLNLPIVDGSPVLDIFRIENIIEYNSFGYGHDPELTSFGNAALTTPGLNNMDGSMGLWVHCSAMNHSCLFNAEHSFIGDMIIFRATRDIAKDEEITTLYKEINADYDIRDAALRTWGFSCDCKLCEADRTCPETPTRKHLMEQTRDLLLQLPLIKALVEPRTAVMMFEDLLVKIEKTYPEEYYHNLPRLGLITLHRYCAFAYARAEPEKSIEHALACIEAHGYKFTMTDDNFEIDRTNAMSAPQVVDQMMNVSRYKAMKGQTILAGKIRELALQIYIIVNGEPSGFQTRYGKA
ncbi:hypothetical protein D6C76_06144 [Aureobasidium pullulans]|uniref:SET domain-containing protein n=1 Tax=Aureobasidium pullulans TaxID=5580 RepID=A0A4S8YA59_AURPU|nr:hypothetical protein D6D22_02076 [Aureobasidium pullulans]TIA74984.1 hypothetical protein D6C76_06144 [Aureobasidium pullulans]